MKKKIINGSILTALIAAIAVFCVMLKIEEKRLAQYERGNIYVAAKEIPKGQLVTKDNYHEFMESCELDVSCIPKAAISTEEQLMDLVAAGRIDEGAMLTRGMFEAINEITEEMEEPVIAGFKADDLYQVVGGTLRTGDRIHLYNVNGEGTAKLVWSNVYVQQVFDNSGRNITSEENEFAAQRINVYMDKVNVEKFYSELAAGALRAVKVCE